MWRRDRGPGCPRGGSSRSDAPARAAAPLPGVFWWYAAFAALTMVGFATFGLVGYHLTVTGPAGAAAVPVIYAGAMVADAVAAGVTGYGYDRWGMQVLVALPVLAAAVPPLAFGTSLPPAVTGAVLWGAALGVQESTLRAVVADLVPAGRRASAYGIFAAVHGLSWAAGGAAVGLLYQVSYPAMVWFAVTTQAVALVLLAAIRRRSQPTPRQQAGGG
ncbi:MAG TPA: MFS transporter [Micromonosporaceae bacterium]|nr:MFS transporter [Micromonosporaceae bacterium]